MTAAIRLKPRDSDPGGSKADLVYSDIRAKILSGELPPGAPIDKTDICERLGVSRFPVAMAINQLAFERLVVIEPQHGSFIARIGVSDVREWMMMRRALECEIVAEIATRIQSGTIDNLRRLLLEAEAATDAGDYAWYFRVDDEFHRAFRTEHGGAYAASVLEMVRMHMERVRRLLLKPEGRLRESNVEHARIVDALRRGDGPGAASAMRAHLDAVTGTLEHVVEAHPEHFHP